jgi:uncharacterized cupredoxin-like copper-binding protein
MNIQKQTWSFGLIALSAVFALFTVGTPLLGTAASSTAVPSPTTEAPQADTVEVVLKDGAVELPSAAAAGAVTFVVENAGETAHGFALSGPVEAQLDERLKAGQEATFTSELEAGSYDAYCPVEGHSEEERATLNVE